MIILLGVGAANFCWFILGSVLFFLLFFSVRIENVIFVQAYFFYMGCYEHVIVLYFEYVR